MPYNLSSCVCDFLFNSNGGLAKGNKRSKVGPHARLLYTLYICCRQMASFKAKSTCAKRVSSFGRIVHFAQASRVNLNLRQSGIVEPLNLFPHYIFFTKQYFVYEILIFDKVRIEDLSGWLAQAFNTLSFPKLYQRSDLLRQIKRETNATESKSACL